MCYGLREIQKVVRALTKAMAKEGVHLHIPAILLRLGRAFGAVIQKATVTLQPEEILAIEKNEGDTGRTTPELCQYDVGDDLWWKDLCEYSIHLMVEAIDVLLVSIKQPTKEQPTEVPSAMKQVPSDIVQEIRQARVRDAEPGVDGEVIEVGSDKAASPKPKGKGKVRSVKGKERPVNNDQDAEPKTKGKGKGKATASQKKADGQPTRARPTARNIGGKKPEVIDIPDSDDGNDGQPATGDMDMDVDENGGPKVSY